MVKSLELENYYIFSTSIDNGMDPEEFIVEISSPDEREQEKQPKKIIRNFDELIAFFENLDEEDSDQ